VIEECKRWFFKDVLPRMVDDVVSFTMANTFEVGCESSEEGFSNSQKGDVRRQTTGLSRQFRYNPEAATGHRCDVNILSYIEQ
tara:strand:+ start:634 stop:882 length:249 start_codon:yes stop_codon:yes gene_type:complete